MENPAEHALNIDSHPNPESQHENPIEKNRRPTNRWFTFIVFIPIFVLWLTACTSGFFADYHRYKDREIFNTYLAFINAPVTKLSLALPITLLFCIAVIYICLFCYEKLTKVCIYISVVFIIFGIIGNCLEVLQVLLGKTTKPHDSIVENLEKMGRQLEIAIELFYVCAFIYALPYLICTITSIICFFKVDKKILCDLTNYSSRLILRNPSSLIFTALMTILKFLLFSFILNAVIYDLFSDRRNSSGIFATFIFIGGLSVVNVVNNYSRMVISEYTIRSFWTKDEKISIVPIVVRVFRNHIGTAMFASTMFLSFFASILQAFKHKTTWRIKENYFFYIVTKFALVITPDTAPIFTAIYGRGFLNSYQKAFDTVLRCSTTYMAMLLVIDGIFLIMCMALSAPVSIIVMLTVGLDDTVISTDLSRIIYGFLYSYLVFELLISSTIKAQLINKIIILNKENHDVEETNLNQIK